MSDDVTELKRRLEEIERKTAIWRSQVVVLLLVFVVGWIASAIWMTVRLEARAANIESRVAKVEAGALKAAKVVEAQAFVLKTEDGREIASLRKVGDSARLTLKGDRRIFEATLSDNGLVITDVRTESAAKDGFQWILASVIADKEGHLSLYDEKAHTHTLSDLVPKDMRGLPPGLSRLPPDFKLDAPPAGARKR